MDQNTLKNIRQEVFQSLNRDLSQSQFDLEVRVEKPDEIKNQVLQYSAEFDTACILNNNYPNQHNSLDFLAGFGLINELKISEPEKAFQALKTFIKSNEGNWMFGFLAYDLKNDVESLTSANEDVLGFPSMHFVVPELLIHLEGNLLKIKSSKGNAKKILQEILALDSFEIEQSALTELDFESKPGKEGYIKAVEELQKEIKLGNIYEINFCRELLTKRAIDPIKTCKSMWEISPAPFSAFYKVDGKYVLCASPERFLMKSNDILLSQPIKGTRRRSLNKAEDEALMKELFNDVKERAENVMIVDLVRNDLSHSASSGSVQVDELFGIYSFPHVHQMISTISSQLRKDVHFVDAIKHCFPMGSMTGAPKLRAMKLIEKHELFKRGVFSGSIGLISPNGNFDFNVVIRSILYNEKNDELSIRTGSAITDLCMAEVEWEECILKSSALLRSIQSIEK